MLHDCYTHRLQKIEREAERPHELVADEIRRASQELQEMALIEEQKVEECLKTGRSMRRDKAAGGGWDHAKISSRELALAVDALRAFPVQRPSAAALIKQARSRAINRGLMPAPYGCLRPTHACALRMPAPYACLHPTDACALRMPAPY